MPADSLPVGKLPGDLLDSLLKRLPTSDPQVVLGPGIGLDCAVVETSGRLLVLKSDPITFASDAIGWYAVQVNANEVLTLDITALVPPAGETLAGGSLPVTVGTAAGWNVYAASDSTAALRKQNAALIPLATKTWTEAVTGLTSGATVATDPPGGGQLPDLYRGVQNALMRG